MIRSFNKRLKKDGRLPDSVRWKIFLALSRACASATACRNIMLGYLIERFHRGKSLLSCLRFLSNDWGPP
jgi:hypothetical protein